MKIKCNCKIHVKPEKLRCERGSFMYSISFEIYTMKKNPAIFKYFSWKVIRRIKSANSRLVLAKYQYHFYIHTLSYYKMFESLNCALEHNIFYQIL